MNDRSTLPMVWLDLDDTLAKYDGWLGLDHIGDPYDGAHAFVEDLRKDARVGIFTCRTKLDLPGRNLVLDRYPALKTEGELAAALVAIIQAWCDKHRIAVDAIYSGQGKPFGHAYVDDKGVSCCPRKHKSAAYSTALSHVRSLLKG